MGSGALPIHFSLTIIPFFTYQLILITNQLVMLTFHMIAFLLISCYDYLTVIMLEHDQALFSFVPYFYYSYFFCVTAYLYTAMTYIIAQLAVYKADLYDSPTLASQLLSFGYT